ncbi:hypothetical protein AOQ84DRAFT_209725, partial [Glonium stellatum]
MSSPQMLVGAHIPPGTYNVASLNPSHPPSVIRLVVTGGISPGLMNITRSVAALTASVGTSSGRMVVASGIQPGTYGLVLLNTAPPVIVIRVMVLGYIPQGTMDITVNRAAIHHHSALRAATVVPRLTSPIRATRIRQLAALKEEAEDTKPPTRRSCPHENRLNQPPPV